MAFPAEFIMFLGVGEQDHESQNRQDASGYDIPYHGCHSPRTSALRSQRPRDQ